MITCEDDDRRIAALEALPVELHVYVEAMRGKVIVFPMGGADFGVEDEPPEVASIG